MTRAIIVTLLLASSLWGMDPERGKQVMREAGCLSCHNVRGEGSMKEPDLAVHLVDRYTPSTFASLLWNHLPEMWSAMNYDKAARPRPTERDAEDLFGYLYSAHYANPAGRQDRGESAFEQRGCAACHTAGPGLPVGKWTDLQDPFALVQKMWNHAPLMRQSREQNGVKFERLSSRDVADIAAYASRGQAKSSMPATLPETRQGEARFKANCSGCHPAIVDLKKRLQDQTPTEVAASLWNHANSMLKVPMAAPNDMRNLVGYVWNQQFQNKGDAVRGAKAFREKGCESCHKQMNRGERIYSEYTLISAVWVHGPLMQADAAKKLPRWPKLAPDDVENLVAFINSKK